MKHKEFIIRKATSADLPAIVAMLAQDELGQTREKYSEPLLPCYYNAFEQISNDENNELLVMENDHQEIIGTLQLTFIPNITLQGGLRALIEGVRIKEQYRGRGYGKKLFEWVIAHAKNRGCCLVQLTSNKKRTEAVRFYEALGFQASHIGMKLYL